MSVPGFLPGFSVYAENTINNAGFLPGNIWYSKDPFFTGDKIEIYTLVFNSGIYEFFGTVEFYDSDKFLGKTNVSVLPGKFQKVPIIWEAKAGYHKFFAVIKNAKLIRQGIGTDIFLDNEKTKENDRFVTTQTTEESATSTIQKYIGEKIDFASQYAQNNLPAPVSESASKAGSVLEDVRVSGKLWADGKGAALNEKIKELTAGEVKGVSASNITEPYKNALNKAEKPFAYLYVFLVSIISTIFGSKLFFYGGLLTLLFFIIRFLKRTFFF